MQQSLESCGEPALRSISSERGITHQLDASAVCGTGETMGCPTQAAVVNDKTSGPSGGVKVPGSHATTVDPITWWSSSFRVLLSTHGNLARFWKSFHRKPGTSREGSTASMWPMPLPYPKLMVRKMAPQVDQCSPFKVAVNLVVVCLNWLHLRRVPTCPEEITLFQPLNNLQWRVVRAIEGCMDAWKVCGPIDSSAMGRTAGKIENLEHALSRLSTFVASSHETISKLPQAGSGFPLKRGSGLFSSGLQRSSPGDIVGSLSGECGQVAKPIEASRLEFRGLPVFDPSPFLDEECR